METRGEEFTFWSLTVKMSPIQQMSSIWPMLRVQAEEKLVPISSREPDGLAPKLFHLGCHMGWVGVQASPWYKALEPGLMKPSDPIGPNYESSGPQSDPKYKVALNGNNINALCKASFSLPARRKYPLPTFWLNISILPLISWFRVCNHNSIAWGGGLVPTNSAIKSSSLNRAKRICNFQESTLNVIASLIFRKPLKFLSTIVGRISPSWALNGLISSKVVYLLQPEIQSYLQHCSLAPLQWSILPFLPS